MLLLDTPITIYPDEYQGLIPVRGEFDLRMKMITLHFAPVQAIENDIFLGESEVTGETTAYRFPELIRTVTLQEPMSESNPMFAALIHGFIDFLENVEHGVVEAQDDTGGIATTPYQLGVKNWSLSCTFEARGERTVTVKVVEP